MAINYADYLAGIRDPMASAMRGFQMGQQIKQGRLQQEDMQARRDMQRESMAHQQAMDQSRLDLETKRHEEQMKALQAQSALRKQQQLEVIRKQQEAQRMQNALTNLSQKEDATASDYIQIMTEYPALADNLQHSLDGMNEVQRKEHESQALNLYSALMSGKNEIAIDLLNKRSEAAKNSGLEQEARAADILKETIRINPDAAKTSTALYLAKSMGPSNFAPVFKAFREAEMKAKGQAAGGVPSELKSSDERLMYGQAAAFFGGIMDPVSGEVTGLDPTVQPRVQSIAVEAARLFQAGESNSKSDAVAMAARKLGIKIPDLSKSDDDEQLKIDQLLEMYPAR